MATIDIGKIKFTWKGAYANTTQYEADDVVSQSGSSWIYIGTQVAATYDNTKVYSLNDVAKDGTSNIIYRYINATAAAGNALTVATHWAVNEPASTNTAYWNIMADGSSPLTTQGDILTHDGSASIRLARGLSGQVLKVSGNDVAYGTESGFTGHRHLLSNYGKTPPSPTASTTYGATGKYNWLADYANNWIPECGTPNPACGPVKNSDKGVQANGHRISVWLNENHELVTCGDDDFGWIGTSTAQKHSMSVCNNISAENGGMRDGDYFVRFWVAYNNIWLCLLYTSDAADE